MVNGFMICMEHFRGGHLDDDRLRGRHAREGRFGWDRMGTLAQSRDDTQLSREPRLRVSLQRGRYSHRCGRLLSAFGIFLSPVVASLEMSFSSVSAITNSLRLPGLRLDEPCRVSGTGYLDDRREFCFANRAR